MIPKWNMSGIIPPIQPGTHPAGPDRSPYTVTLESVIDRFSTTQKRTQILQGFLEYRRHLHTLGMINGFQWLDGSFLEDIETLEGRPPNDMDIVTYFHLPNKDTQATLLARSGKIFDNGYVKQTYSIDAFYEVLGEPTTANHVKKISYWYSLWSHRRNSIWKGFLQVSLDDKADANAADLLEQKIKEGEA